MGRFLSALPVRPRTAVALGLLLVVALVVLVGKLIGGTAPLSTPDGSSRLSTVDPTTGDDGVADVSASPSLKQPTTGQPALGVATSFAEQWINTDRSAAAWRAALKPLSTKTLTSELELADPATVPAKRITGAAVTQVHAEASVDIVFPTDAGKLRLRLVFVADGRWLVDGIDWERA